MNDLLVYVPAPGSAFERELEPASAVLGTKAGNGLAWVAVEEPRYGGMNSTYADRLETCVARLRARLRSVRTDQLIEVGTFDASAGLVRIEYARAARQLAAWLGSEELDETELRTTRSVLGEIRREIGRRPATRPPGRGFHSS
jgi:hypothetical protein